MTDPKNPAHEPEKKSHEPEKVKEPESKADPKSDPVKSPFAPVSGNQQSRANLQAGNARTGIAGNTLMDYTPETEPATKPGASQPDDAEEGKRLNPPVHQAQRLPELEKEEGDFVLYSSHPVMNYRIGNDYVFEKGVLRLEKKDQKRFEDLLAKQPPIIRSQVRHLDPKKADELIAEVQSRKIAGIDTTANSIGPGAVDGTFSR